MSTDQTQYARMLLADPGSSAVQSILLTDVIGGTFTVSFGVATSAAIAWNAPANVVQNALTALSTIGVGNLTVQNGGVLHPYNLFFIGALAGAAQAMGAVNTVGLVASVPGGATPAGSAGGPGWAFALY